MSISWTNYISFCGGLIKQGPGNDYNTHCVELPHCEAGCYQSLWLMFAAPSHSLLDLGKSININ